MATIGARPDNMTIGVWWLVWIEREEIVAKVERNSEDSFKILPEGPHWSPMKSFGQSYAGLNEAVGEVQLYFKLR